MTGEPTPGGAWGALLLFAANVVAMIVAGTIVFTLCGYHRAARQAPGAIPDGHDLLFVLRHDGHLEPATRSAQPSPSAGETLVLLGPGS